MIPVRCNKYNGNFRPQPKCNSDHNFLASKRRRKIKINGAHYCKINDETVLFREKNCKTYKKLFIKFKRIELLKCAMCTY